MPSQVPIAAEPIPFAAYKDLALEELHDRIRRAKETLKDRLVLLVHNYQRDEVWQHADFTGDSLKLSQQAAREAKPFIVFCGVHFMAEVADLLTGPDQAVILPDLAAGCSMADMAEGESVERAWQELATVLDADKEITPVTYINSSAELKAFCGARGGTVCTSSNAAKVLAWAFERRSKALFFPDQHLGRNTGRRMGIPLEQMPLWDPAKPLGGLTPEAIGEARILLWKGFCSVHQMFRPQHIAYFRRQHPGIHIIVHPECAMEVVDLADEVGSTETIIQTVRNAPEGTIWAVGTELNLVNRLKEECRGKKQVYFLCPTVCLCSTMFRIDAPHLCWALENLAEGQVVNRIIVPDEHRHWARTAIDRMLEISRG